MQLAHPGFGLVRELRQRGETRAFERAPRGRRKLGDKSMLRLAPRLASRAARAARSLEEHVSFRTHLALPHHTSFAYTMNPKFFATLSYSVRPGVFVVCVCQYTRLQPASLAMS